MAEITDIKVGKKYFYYYSYAQNIIVAEVIKIISDTCIACYIEDMSHQELRTVDPSDLFISEKDAMRLAVKEIKGAIEKREKRWKKQLSALGQCLESYEKMLEE